MNMEFKGFGLSQTVEVNILNNTAQKYVFPDNQTSLDNSLIHGFVLHTSNVGKSLKGKALLTDNEVRKGFLTMADISDRQYNAVLPFYQMLIMPGLIIKPRMFNIRSSFIELPLISAYGGIPAGGAVILITFFYKRYNPAKHTLNGLGELESETDY